MAYQHDHQEESNLRTGMLGFGIGLAWLFFVIYVSHLLALNLHH